MATFVVDSYSESNNDGYQSLFNGSYTIAGQSFTALAGLLNSAKFHLYKEGSPTGNMTAYLYAHSGTYGTSSVPTGSALATSGTVSIATLSASYTLVTFTFTGTNKYRLVKNTYYVITVQYGGGDVSNRLRVGFDGSSPTHSGNGSRYQSSWGAIGQDLCFYVYADPIPATGFSGVGNPMIF
jgi:hypothetical protein